MFITPPWSNPDNDIRFPGNFNNQITFLQLQSDFAICSRPDLILLIKSLASKEFKTVKVEGRQKFNRIKCIMKKVLISHHSIRENH